MTHSKPVALILAAGKGTRMRSALPKVLHLVAGRSMIERVLDTAMAAGLEHPHVVVGFGHEQVRARMDGAGWQVQWVHQIDQRGTGDAVRAARGHLGERAGTVVVLSGDVPLLTPASLTGFLAQHRSSGAAASLVTVRVDDPAQYGRIVRERPGGPLSRIVEARDADPVEKRIDEINAGLYAFDGPTLFRYVDRLGANNAKNEYYLTDVFGMMVADGVVVNPVAMAPAAEFLGINSRVELAQAEAVVRERKVRALMEAGVTVHDPRTTYVDDEVVVGADTVLFPGVSLYGKTVVGERCEVRSGTVVRDSVLHDGVVVRECSLLDQAVVGEATQVGPFAHLRPGARLGRDVRVGNFVEVKNATLGDRTKASHLSYLGDAALGADVNIGAGTITCNYDGFHKNRTVIGDGVFVGSDSILVAPVELGDRSFVAASSVVTRDVPAGALAIARERQVNKEGYREILENKHADSCPICKAGGGGKT